MDSKSQVPQGAKTKRKLLYVLMPPIPKAALREKAGPESAQATRQLDQLLEATKLEIMTDNVEIQNEEINVKGRSRSVASVNTALPRKRKRIIYSDSDVEEKVTPNALDNAQAEIKSPSLITTKNEHSGPVNRARSEIIVKSKLKGSEGESSEEEESEEGEIASCGVNARNNERKRRKVGMSPHTAAATSRKIYGKYSSSNKDRIVNPSSRSSEFRNKCISNARKTGNRRHLDEKSWRKWDEKLRVLNKKRRELGTKWDLPKKGGTSTSRRRLSFKRKQRSLKNLHRKVDCLAEENSNLKGMIQKLLEKTNN